MDGLDTRCSDTGQCNCQALVTGRKCDRCIAGYYGLLLSGDQLGICKCKCSINLNKLSESRPVDLHGFNVKRFVFLLGAIQVLYM